MNRPVGIVKGMATKVLAGSVRERLLAAADELFYKEGVHTVGIERVLERAGVAKASLYSTFGSKDELVRAYLEQRNEVRKRTIAERVGRHHAPRARMLAVFDALADRVAEPTFRGCAFVNASAEGADPKVRKVCSDTRAWTRALFAELAKDAGAADPDRLARQLVLIYDGALVGARMDKDVGIAAEARATAAELIDASTR
jgi:AcrR family transcriptional regulator